MAGDPDQLACLRSGLMVSIRARHRWRAIPAKGMGITTQELFQSAPAIDGGRSRRCTGRSPRRASFNPRPPSMAGDPKNCCSSRQRWRCFNPRPPSMAGDPRDHARADGRAHVSIRARHRWRAIQDPIHRGYTDALFQSAPAIDGGRSDPAAVGSGETSWFQSAPAIDGGRSLALADHSDDEGRFQSAPAIDGGRSPAQTESEAS